MMEAISSILLTDCRCVVVMSEEDRVVGVFSEGDVLRAILNGSDVHTPLKKLIHPDFKFLRENDRDKALGLIKSGFTLIPVVDENFKLESVITFKDAL